MTALTIPSISGLCRRYLGGGDPHRGVHRAPLTHPFLTVEPPPGCAVLPSRTAVPSPLVFHTEVTDPSTATAAPASATDVIAPLAACDQGGPPAQSPAPHSGTCCCKESAPRLRHNRTSHPSTPPDTRTSCAKLPLLRALSGTGRHNLYRKL